MVARGLPKSDHLIDLPIIMVMFAFNKHANYELYMYINKDLINQEYIFNKTSKRLNVTI